MLKKGTWYKMEREQVLDYCKELPTVKVEQMVVRQVGHPLGDWRIFKPTLKHEYFMELL